MVMANIAEIKYQLQEYEPNLSVPTQQNIENIISGIENDQKALYEQALINFLVKEYQVFDIEELKEENKREILWNSLIKLATKSKDNDLLAVVFTVFRIISRDKASVNKLATQPWLDLLIFHTGLNDKNFDYTDDSLCKIEEGQKVLWNVLYNSPEIVKASIENGFLNKILHRISLYDKVWIPDAMKFYDIKYTFYMTAISNEVRQRVVSLNGLKLFTSVLKLLLKDTAESLSQSPRFPAVFNDLRADIASEVLKVLFNITINSFSASEDELILYRDLVRVLQDYLLASTLTLDKTWQLRNNIVNLLTNVPAACYTELLSAVDGSLQTTPIPRSLKFENLNMIVIYEILMFLEVKFKDQTAKMAGDAFSPILTVLLKGATAHRPIRKYLRAHILPPLKDMENRPEETDTLRGHLCKFLTSRITQIRDLTAELLFVLCKGNVSRMIKYTGFGNSAGLLAQKGLLGGQKYEVEGDYSSDSENSETEEYSEQKHRVNPILGCVEKPHANPMEGMTDEQKEYEALKLVQQIDELTKSGLIQPCVVGKDGKPQPISHVLELQEGLKAQKITENDSDSD
ncbi:synembryn-A isoform X1 [Euwallacea similis]|uniref:synembryn-A isoform X1 n=2 Tax=Euwallacea similis TaxID=1736056 RepID=UPI00344F86EA